MNISLVMTVIGEDRPGLVDSVAKLISDHGGNWLESRMSHLAGQFAGILRVQLASEDVEKLKASLKSLEGEGLRVMIATETGARASGPVRVLRLELVGQDRPGIVREISQALAARGVNVEELNTECASAPMSGEVLFKAEALLQIPAATSLDELRGDMETIASDLMVDILLEED